MQAWQVTRHAEPSEALRLSHSPLPSPTSSQVLVRVGATACNYADTLLCRGRYQVNPDMPFTPGLETCGVIESVGRDAPADLVGRRVLGQPVLPHGGFAEYALMDAGTVIEVPEVIPDTEAATLHLTYLTAWLALHRRTRMTRGDTVVVTSAAGGVGLAASQLAMAGGAHLIAIVSGADKRAMLESQGVEFVIDRLEGDVVEKVRRLCPQGGADIVFESIGGDSYEQARRYVGFEGQIVVVGFASGTIPLAKLSHPFVKNYTIAGLHWNLYWQHQPNLVRQAQSDIFTKAQTGQIAPLISRAFDIEGVADALGELASGRTHGKLVMTAPT
ncbi:NADPH:quinone oxidoreductase family protein [Saccharopolyspora sp. NPDC049426]|uniref:NADPH:quinone oxidoreductase family protein n=1 Tax=Saccharopolyspora sp. NPDC049426 TaxID=3155652 RepID=UPI00343E7C00